MKPSEYFNIVVDPGIPKGTILVVPPKYRLIDIPLGLKLDQIKAEQIVIIKGFDDEYQSSE